MGRDDVEGLGEDVLVVAQAVVTHADVDALRDELAVHDRAALEDLAVELGTDGRRHAQGFLDEGLEILATMEAWASCYVVEAVECG